MKNTMFVVSMLVLGLVGCQSAPTSEKSTEIPATVVAPAPAAMSAPTILHVPEGKSGMRSLQKALAVRGYYHGRVDGKNGPATRKAVSRFQQNIGVTPTGNVDSKTWSALGLSG